MNNNRGNNRRRGRGNNRPQGGGQQLNRIDSRARGNAPQLLEKYRKMAQDAHLNGDRVQAEYYLQFADHYFRVIADTRLRQEEARQRHSGNGERWNEGEAEDDGMDFSIEGDFPAFDRPYVRREEREARNQDRPERSERQERPERQDRPERQERSERADRGDRQDRNADGDRGNDRGSGRRRFEERRPSAQAAAPGEAGSGAGADQPVPLEGVRADEGEPVTDGVFPESKEFLAGFWIVDVDSAERALAIAAEASAAPGPSGPLRMAIEVRQVLSAPPVE